MIPRLPLAPEPSADTLAFVDALREAGFEGDLSTADADRTVLATDNSVYELVPQAVVFPRRTGDLARILRLLAEDRFGGLSIAPRGGGTGTNGQSLTDGIVVDVSRHMNRILEIDPEDGRVRVQAGVVKDQLNAALKPYGLFFAPELSTSNRATIGGMISTDASGQGSCLYGKTRDHVLELVTVLTDGTIWRSSPLDDESLRTVQRRSDRVGAIHRALDTIDREHRGEIAARFPKLNRCLTGYDLAHLRDPHGRFDLNAVLCGSEGTLGLLAEATLRVLPIPRHVALVNLRYASFDAALRDARALASAGAASVETVDSRVLALAQRDIVWDAVRDYIPDDADGPARGINLVEFVGHAEAEMEKPLARLAATLDAEGRAHGRTGYTIARGEAPVRAIWEMRKRAVGLLGSAEGEARPIAFVEDTAVPPEHLADYIAEFCALLDARGLSYGMFGHVDAGVLHVRPALDMKAPGAEATLREVTEAVVTLTERYGGLLWGEHGKGVRSEFSPRAFGPLYPLVQAVKTAFDPRNQLNPGKIATPGKGELLRVDGVPTRGAADRRIPAPVRAAYAEAVHCNGNGACFSWDPDDAMCPSWKATRERRHSPKGRAMLVKEWLRRLSAAGTDLGEEVRRQRATPAWRRLPRQLRATLGRRRGDDFSHAVKEAMDGCLACKSCAGGCPVKVNVPAFRARFLELYHGRYLRPAKDHAVAALEHVLPVAARVPRLHNAVVSSRLGSLLLRQLGLVDAPRLAGIDLGRELARRGVAVATPAALSRLRAEERARAVILVQDAFTTHYETGLVLDVLELLRLLGATPWLAPLRPNGKALHVHGFLGRFARVAEANAAMLRSLAATGVELVGLDPSMTLTYRAEYAEALGADAAPNVLLLQEWLARRTGPMPAGTGGPYRLLPHCTEGSNAASSLRDWVTVFNHAGLRLDVVRAGCCGMAGTYGHEAEQRDTSARIYDLSWRRHLADAASEPIATGYSCRSQAKRLDGAAPRHPATALLAALRAHRPSAPVPNIEETMSTQPVLTRRSILAAGVVSLAAPALAQSAWPAGRPIEVIVGFAPGGGTDVMVRALMQALTPELPGANFVVLNRPGAGGESAYVALQGAKPDGFTFGTINTPGYLSLGVQRRVRYDRSQIRMIARLVDDPSAFVVHRESPYRTLQDLVEAAKRKPGTISVGSSGIGTDDHLGLTLFEAASGAEFIHVPFAGAGPVRNAALGRQIDVAGLNLGEMGMLGQEQPPLRAIAGMGERRWELMPDVPTFRELGFDVIMTSERGLGAPRGVPDEIARRMEDAIAKVIAGAEWAEKVRQLELAMAFLRGAEWEAQMPAQLRRYEQIWEKTPWQ